MATGGAEGGNLPKKKFKAPSGQPKGTVEDNKKSGEAPHLTGTIHQGVDSVSRVTQNRVGELLKSFYLEI